MRHLAFREGRARCEMGENGSARRPRLVLSARCGAVVAVCLALSGCGFSIPIKPLAGDDVVTGSITPAENEIRLAPGLTDEDWRRASNAMSVALDPLGNGERAGWDNPETGHSGAFRPAGLPFVRAGEVCRAWVADVKTKVVSRHQEGTSCRAPGEDWRIAANQKVAEAR